MNVKKPRYSRLSDLLELLILIYKNPLGITINEISEHFSVSRRTAERMLDAIKNVFPEIDVIDTFDTQKHWGVTGKLGLFTHLNVKADYE